MESEVGVGALDVFDVLETVEGKLGGACAWVCAEMGHEFFFSIDPV